MQAGPPAAAEAEAGGVAECWEQLNELDIAADKAPPLVVEAST